MKVVGIYIQDAGTLEYNRVDLFDDEKISVTSSIQNINDISKTNINLNNGFLFHYSFIILLVLLLFIAIVLLNFVDQILIQYFLLFVCYILYLTQK